MRLPNLTRVADIRVLLILIFRKSIGFAVKLTDGFSKMTKRQHLWQNLSYVTTLVLMAIN